MAQQTITAPSGRTYQWNKPTPPTAEDWAALQEYDASLGHEPTTAQPKAQQPTLQQLKIQAEQGRMTPEQVEASKRTARNLLPVAGAVVGSALTGGAAYPLIPVAAAGGGAMAGQALKDAPESMTPRERVTNAVLSGIGAALTEGTGQALQAAGPMLKTVGRSWWQKAAKIGEPVAKKTQTMRAGGSLPAAKAEIAETVLASGHGAIGKGSVEALQGELSQLDDALDAVLANSKGFVERDKLQAAIIQRASEIGEGTLTQEAQQQALEKAFDLLDRAPKRMTLAEANKRKREIYQAYKNTYAADAATSAAASADKTTARAIKEEIAKQAPEAAEINARMSRLMPAVSAVEKATSRVTNHDVASLTKTLAAAVTNPKTIAAALVNDPWIGSFTAQQIYNAAKLLPKDGRTPANILRVLKIGLTPEASHQEGGQ